MTTTQLELLNDNKWYLVTRIDGVIVRQQAADVIPPTEQPHITRIRQILNGLEDKVFRDATTLTALERDRLIVLIARMIYQKSF